MDYSKIEALQVLAPEKGSGDNLTRLDKSPYGRGSMIVIPGLSTGLWPGHGDKVDGRVRALAYFPISNPLWESRVVRGTQPGGFADPLHHQAKVRKWES